jgi:formate dehydrogenase subunit beta
MDTDEIEKDKEAKETDAEIKEIVTDEIEIDTIEKEMEDETQQAETEPEEVLYAKIDAKDGVEKAINNILLDALEKKYFDAVLMPHRVPTGPHRVPTGDSFVYLLISDPKVLATASPLAPIMPTQGARALSSVTHLGTDGLKVVAVMRPCEVRAAIELSKLDQNILENVTLISLDCPGVLPTKVFNEDPTKGLKLFNTGMNGSDTGSMRPACQVCDKAYSATGDLHFSKLGVDNGYLLFIHNTQKGEELLAALGLTPEVTLDNRQAKVEELILASQSKRDQVKEDLKKNNLGLENLLDTFSNCLKCHNCMRVCPMDYCQSCYFESDDMKQPPEEYFARAATGSLRFPVDTLQYHLGRMLHMSMSCVACGTCEDACPMSLPISQIYSNVADEVQQVFDYTSGLDPAEPRPLATYEPEEFTELEG